MNIYIYIYTYIYIYIHIYIYLIGVGFMIHKYTKDTIMEFTPNSSRICTIRIKTKPLNITIL